MSLEVIDHQQAAPKSGGGDTFRPAIQSLLSTLTASQFFDLDSGHLGEVDPSTCEAILEAAGELFSNEFAPLNRTGDQSPPRLGAVGVQSTPGFKDAYRAFVRGGWNCLAADERWGGQGLPKALEYAIFEIAQAANSSLALCPMLTQGAIEALVHHGSERQQRLILPKLVSGVWTGTMNLTEPQAGTDLSAVATRAEPDGRGGYRLRGQKIFITWGDHDMAENIVHLVLARLPGAPAGIGGVSLFLATKFDVDDSGSLGARNAVHCASLEEKLGIHGSPTCVMMFDDARAELVGEPGKGVAQMFTMMNSARLHVGVQGVGLAERACQQALRYAQERVQGRPSLGSSGVILDHPEVRRTLGLMRAKTEAARGIYVMAAVAFDRARSGDRAAQARGELLTPVAKAWATDVGVEVASLGVQIHGGAGFIEETGAAQYYRDARIGPIYEGTNGIQALDLIGRKLAHDGGQAMAALIEEIEHAASTPALQRSVQALREATDWILAHPGPDAQAGATRYLQLAGDVIGGYSLWRRAQATADPAAPDAASIYELYANQVLSGSQGLAESVKLGAEALRAAAV